MKIFSLVRIGEKIAMIQNALFVEK